MRPGFMPGRIIIAVSPARRLRVGDVVIVRHNGAELLKRVSQLEAGRLYVLGDDPARSTDSRDFGWLEYASLCGRVVWPRLYRARRASPIGVRRASTNSQYFLWWQ